MEPTVEDNSQTPPPIDDSTKDIGTRQKIIFGVLLCFLLISSGVFAYQSLQPNQDGTGNTAPLPTEIPTSTTGTPATTPTTQPAVSPVPVTPNYSLSIPPHLNLNQDAIVKVQTLDEIREYYQQLKATGEFCPGACSILIEGNNLEKQFDILSTLASLGPQECTLTAELENSIRRDFRLFDGSTGGKQHIELIFHTNLNTCGMKFYGIDSYVYMLEDFEYEAGFLVNDTVVRLRFDLFPRGVFDTVDTLWRDLGFDETGGCADCLADMETYMQDLSFDHEPVHSVIQTYDAIVASFRFD